MAISRERKEEVVERVAQAFQKSHMTVLVDYTGLSVGETQELRRLLRDNNVGYTVAKNTLVKRAMETVEHLKNTDTSIFAGPVAMAFGYEDEAMPAQLLHKFGKEHEAIEMLGGIDREGAVLTSEQIKALAQLPGKEELRGQLVGTIAAPLSGFARVLNGNVRGLMNVLNAAAEQTESG